MRADEGLSRYSIDQKTTSNPRSTVGTVTKFMITLDFCCQNRHPPLSKCGKEIKDRHWTNCRPYYGAAPRTKIQLLARLRGRKGEHVKVLENAKKSSYVRVRVDGII